MTRTSDRALARRREDGSVAVEFALIFPILMYLVFGIISFGIVLAQELALGNASREAARAGVTETATCGQVRTAAASSASSIAMNAADVTVSVARVTTAGAVTVLCDVDSATVNAIRPCEGSAAGDSLRVTLAFDSELLIPLVLVEDTFPLSSTGVFRCEFV